MKTLPEWGRSTKQLISATLLILAGLLVYSFRTILIPIVLVLLFSFIVAPVVGWLSRCLHIGRGWAVLLTYLVLGGVLATLPAVTIPVIVDEVESLIENLDAIGKRAITWIEQWDAYQLHVMGYTITLPEIASPTTSFDLDRAMSLLESTISPLAGGAFSVVKTVASGVGWMTLMSVMAFYLLKDAERIGPAALNIVPPAYRPETRNLLAQINGTWSAFLRGQLALCMIIGVMTAIATSAVGLRFSIALGIVAGVLEIIPSMGPTLAAIPAILLALFRGSSYIPLSNLGMAILVAVVYYLIQAIENNFLVPRIIGSSLHLHPMLVIVGVLGGATVGGTLGPLGTILGALLAAPILATLRHVLRYVYCKLIDVDPFPEPPSFATIVRDRNVRAILFDLDGTLLDTDDVLVKRWAARLGRIPILHKLYDGERLARNLVMAMESPMNALITVLDILGLDKQVFALSEWFRLVYGQRKPTQYVAVDGTVRFVKELSAQYDLAITTTRNRADTLRFIEQFDLGDCFRAVVTRQDVKRLKPHPEPIKRAAEQLGYPPERCIVVGDTAVDVHAGKRAGALTVSVLCGFGERSELERLRPDLILETTAQLQRWLPRQEPSWQENW